MQIRPMTEKDLEAFIELAEQLGYPCKVEDVRSRFEQINQSMTQQSMTRQTMTRQSARHCLLVAVLPGEEIAGFIQVHLEPMTLLSEANAEVAALVVDKKHRGKKIGQALLKQAEAWAMQNHMPTMRVRSNAKREDAKKFYLREGYEVAKISNIFRKSLKPAF